MRSLTYKYSPSISRMHSLMVEHPFPRRAAARAMVERRRSGVPIKEVFEKGRAVVFRWETLSAEVDIHRLLELLLSAVAGGRTAHQGAWLARIEAGVRGTLVDPRLA